MKEHSTKPRTDKLRLGRNWGGDVLGRARRAPVDEIKLLISCPYSSETESPGNRRLCGVLVTIGHNARLARLANFQPLDLGFPIRLSRNCRFRARKGCVTRR